MKLSQIFQSLHSIPSIPQALYRDKGNAATIKSIQIKQVRHMELSISPGHKITEMENKHDWWYPLITMIKGSKQEDCE